MAETEDAGLAQAEIVYLILLTIFMAGVLYYLYDSSNSADVWEDFYAKQTVSFLNSGSPGEIVSFDMQKAVQIAKRNGLDISKPENLIRIDSMNNEVCVALSKGGGNCYPYFKDVAVKEVKSNLGAEGMVFSFVIVDKEEEDA